MPPEQDPNDTPTRDADAGDPPRQDDDSTRTWSPSARARAENPLRGLVAEARPDTPSISLPERVAYLRVERFFAKGGMGEVYEAFNLNLKRVVALKVMRWVDPPAPLAAQFQHEAESLARLRHPAIAEVFSAGVFETPQGRRQYIEMEWVGDGPTLEDAHLLASLSLRERMRVLAEVSEGIAHAHAQGEVHGDIKPANVRVVTRNGRRVPKIVDLGLARFAWGEARAGESVGGGTRGYTSPELRARGLDRPDYASDIYALGRTIERVLALGDPARRLIAGPRVCAIVDGATRALDGTPARTPLASGVAEELRACLASPLEGARSRWKALGLARPIVAGVLLAIVLGLVVFGVGTLAFFGVDLRAPFSGVVGASAPIVRSLENSIVVALTDDDHELARAAAHASPESIAADVDRRVIYAALARAFAQAHPRIVVWDIFFYEPRGSAPGAVRALETRALVKSLDELEDSGVVSLLSHPSWDVPQVPGYEPSPIVFSDRRRAGPSTANPCLPWGLVVPILVHKRDAEPMPSVSLLAAASWHFPTFDARFELGPAGEDVFLIHQRKEIGRIASRRERIPLRDVVANLNDPDSGLYPGDRVAVLPVRVGPDALYAGSTFPISRVLRMEPSELARLVRDKVVLVADFRSVKGADSVFSIEDGGLVHGCFLQAAAIETLISRRWMIVASLPAQIGATLLGAGVGIALLAGGVAATRTRKKRTFAPTLALKAAFSIAAAILGIGLVLLACTTLLSQAAYHCHPAVPALAAAAGAFAGWLLPRVSAGFVRDSGGHSQ